LFPVKFLRDLKLPVNGVKNRILVGGEWMDLAWYSDGEEPMKSAMNATEMNFHVVFKDWKSVTGLMLSKPAPK
jgi:hypothetical protein